jgi:flagellar biosynthesis chaperone FliJ
MYPGLKAKNEDVANKAEKLLPGIKSQQLSNYAQFVVQ